MDTEVRLADPVVAGTWWRFARYELRNGYVQPAEGAALEEYDPWEAYETTLSGGRRQAPPPYQALLTVAARLRFRPRGAVGSRASNGLMLDDALNLRGSDGRLLLEPTPDTLPFLLTWCAEYGLLGLLLHQARLLRRPIPNRPDRIADLTSSHSGWGQSVGAPGGSWAGPGVLVQDLAEPWHWRVKPVGTTWGRFFPKIPAAERETYDYPTPGEAFWRLYGEPLVDVLNAVVMLRDAVDLLRYRRPLRQASDEERQSMALGRLRLEALLAPMGMWLELALDGSVKLRWGGPSLLSFLALMAAHDVANRRRILECEVCGAPFVSADIRAIYCSRKCRITGQKRKQRARAKASSRQGTRRKPTRGKQP